MDIFAGEIVLLRLILHIFDIHSDQYHVIGASRCNVVGNLHSSNFCITSCMDRVRGVKDEGRKEGWRKRGREEEGWKEGEGRGKEKEREGGKYTGGLGIH